VNSTGWLISITVARAIIRIGQPHQIHYAHNRQTGKPVDREMLRRIKQAPACLEKAVGKSELRHGVE
jgi:hypothetical protein